MASIRGGIRRSGRGRRAAVQTADSDTIYVQTDQSLESTQSELSSSATLSDGTPDDDQVPAAAAPEPIDLQTLNTILQQREDQLVDRILTHLNRPQNPPSPTPGQNLESRNQPQDQPFYFLVGSELGEGPRVPDNRGMFTPLPILHDESASASIDSVEILFPGVERSTLTQIIENRF